MKTATLLRLPPTAEDPNCDQGTFGQLYFTDAAGKKYTWASLELPYRDVDADGLSDNEYSCLPPGTYIFTRWLSPTFGFVYKMQDDAEAPNRSEILIHAANVGGDIKKGFATQLKGCIALGLKKVLFKKGTRFGKTLILAKDQCGVSASRTAVAEFETVMNQEPFSLIIQPAVRRGEP